MASNILEQIKSEVQRIDDPKKKEEAFLRIIAKCIDKGLLQFKGGNDAGYLEEMEEVEGYDPIEVDRILSEDEALSEKSLPTMRGKYGDLKKANNSVSKAIFNNMPYDKDVNVLAIRANRSPDGENKSVCVRLKNSAEVAEKLKELNAEDERYFTTICNMVYEGTRKATPTQLYRRAFQDKNASPTPSQLARMDESIRKMASIYLKLDCKELFEAYPDLQKMRTGANFIRVEEWAERKTANGEVSEYYTFDPVLPILFQYSLIVGQWVMLQINGATPYDTNLRNTAENREIVEIIGNRLTTLAGMKKNGKTITKAYRKIPYKNFYEKMDFSECGSNKAITNKQGRVRKTIKKQLTFLQSQQQLAGYEEESDGVIIYDVVQEEKKRKR